MIHWEHEGDSLTHGIGLAWIGTGPRVRVRTRDSMWYFRLRLWPLRLFFERKRAPFERAFSS